MFRKLMAAVMAVVVAQFAAGCASCGSDEPVKPAHDCKMGKGAGHDCKMGKAGKAGHDCNMGKAGKAGHDCKMGKEGKAGHDCKMGKGGKAGHDCKKDAKPAPVPAPAK